MKAFGFEIRTEGVNSRSQVDAFLGIEYRGHGFVFREQLPSAN